MAYPGFGIQKGSKRQVLSGERTDRSDNGYPRKRVLFQKEYYEFFLIHLLKEADYNTLMDHYRDNRDKTFDFTWIDGQDYLCEYVEPPEEEPEVGGLRWVSVHIWSVS